MDTLNGYVNIGGDRSYNHPQPAFCFPLLKSGEILQCMEEMEIPLEKLELTEPGKHRERMKQVWFRLLQLCTGKSEEEIKNPYQLPEESSEEMMLMHSDKGDLPLFRALRQFMGIVGYDRFSMRDIYAPDPKRLKHQLSAVINFVKFREDNLAFYSELCKSRVDLVAALEEVDLESKHLYEQLTESQASSEVKCAELEEVKNECHELELEIARDSQKQAALRDEAATLKKQENDLKDEITGAELTLEELEAQEQNLRALVVSSPDRRKAEVEELHLRVQSEKKENIAVDNNIQKCKARIRNLQKAEKDLKTTSGMLIGLRGSAHKCISLIQSLEETEKKIADGEKKLYDIQEETEQVQRRGHRYQEEILAQRKQQALQLEAVQEALDTFKSQLLLVEKERREGMLRVQQGELEVRSLKEAMNAERAKTEQEIKEMTAEYKKIERAFLERDRLRLETLGIQVDGSGPTRVGQ